MGFLQLGGGVGFPGEAGAVFGILGVFVGEDLQGDEALLFGVAGLVDRSHAAFAQQPVDLVDAELCADAFVQRTHHFPRKLY